MTSSTRTLGAGSAVALASSLLFAAPAAPDVPGVGEPGGPTRELDDAGMEQWLRGRERFIRPFHRSRGLGLPNLNGDSCRACHQDPAVGGAGALELNVSRFARDNDGQGPYEDLPGGQAASKLFPPYVEGREEYDPLLADVFEQRQTPTLLGAGEIDGIAEIEILSREDPDDLDGDGVRGVARLVAVGAGTEVGRFGWKAQLPRLEDFIRDAMGAEMGITTSDDGRGFAFTTDGDGVPDPELQQDELDDMLFFLANLGPPPRGGSMDPAVAQGELLFDQIGCAKCHVPSMPGANGPVPLYSDLLLHDVMAPDFRGMSEEGAEVGMYRTPPLWGIRDTEPYMHDGRAETIERAIADHQGEAQAVRDAFDALAPDERDALLAFLHDL